MTDETRKTLAEWYVMFEENGGDLVADSAIERLKGGNMTAANKTTETETKFDTSAPSYSRAEMLHALANDEVDHDRAVATAAELEHLITWMRARGLDAGVAPIPALRTLGEALGTDGPSYNAGRAEGRADLCAALRAVLDPNDNHHWNLDGVLSEVRRLVSLEKALAAIVGGK